MPPRLLLVLPTTTYRARDFVQAAHALDARVVVASERRQALEKKAPGHTLALDFHDPERADEQVRAFARRYPIDAVLGVDDHTAVLAARAARALGLPHNDPEAVEAASDKYLLRLALSRAHLPTPCFQLCSLREDPARAAARMAFPCVLKPTFLAASRGVIRADDAPSFCAAWQRLQTLLARPEFARHSRADRLLVEDYIPGAELALEGLLVGGHLHLLALFDKPDPLEGPFFAETLYVTPSRQADAFQEQIRARTEQAARALGLREGPVHAELRYNGEGVWVIELAARTIGGLCARILRFGAGLSLEELVLRQALGLPAEGLQRVPGAAGVAMLPVPEKGVLEGVDGLDEARLQQGVEGVDITIPRGQPVEPLPEGDRYLGFVFARAPRPEQVEEALRRATACIRPLIRPAPASP